MPKRSNCHVWIKDFLHFSGRDGRDGRDGTIGAKAS